MHRVTYDDSGTRRVTWHREDARCPHLPIVHVGPELSPAEASTAPLPPDPVPLAVGGQGRDVDPPIGCVVAGVLIALGALGGVVALLIGGAP